MIMKKPELIPTAFFIIALIFTVVIPYNWESIITNIAIAQPLAKVFSIVGLSAVCIGILASYYFFYKSVTRPNRYKGGRYE